ncbi:MAG: rubrerythrin family protein [Candidatus Thorarchaeota archaeon]
MPRYEVNTVDLKGTKTEKNLLTSFAGESQARNRYTMAASTAKKEGYQHIAAIFLETADHEKEHAKRFFKYLKQGGATETISVEWDFPTSGSYESTEEILRHAAAGEKFEYTEMYPKFADIAEEEGFKDIAHQWRMIARAEKWHHERYIALSEQIADGSIFKKTEKVEWRCDNCGYIHDGEHPPEKCPACQHEKGYFMLHFEEY